MPAGEKPAAGTALTALTPLGREYILRPRTILQAGRAELGAHRTTPRSKW
jgi:hypothetical protein